MKVHGAEIGGKAWGLGQVTPQVEFARRPLFAVQYLIVLS